MFYPAAGLLHLAPVFAAFALPDKPLAPTCLGAYCLRSAWRGPSDTAIQAVELILRHVSHEFHGIFCFCHQAVNGRGMKQRGRIFLNQKW